MMAIWRRLYQAIFTAAFLTALVTLASHALQKETQPVRPNDPPPIPVGTAKAKKGNPRVFLTGLGSVTALNTVTVRSRVDGELIRFAVSEGQKVSAGDILAEIDPRPFHVELMQA